MEQKDLRSSPQEELLQQSAKLSGETVGKFVHLIVQVLDTIDMDEIRKALSGLNLQELSDFIRQLQDMTQKEWSKDFRENISLIARWLLAQKLQEFIFTDFAFSFQWYEVHPIVHMPEEDPSPYNRDKRWWIEICVKYFQKNSLQDKDTLMFNNTEIVKGIFEIASEKFSEKWLKLWKYTDEFYLKKQAFGSAVCDFVLL